jgi:Glutathione S-transferase, N-terminal domain
MSATKTITVFHAPQTRSSGIVNLLEELHAPYEIYPVNLKAGEQRQPDFLKVNPMGKVPAIRHGDALITEQVAIGIYLADLFSMCSTPLALSLPWSTAHSSAKQGRLPCCRMVMPIPRSKRWWSSFRAGLGCWAIASPQWTYYGARRSLG